MIIGISIIAVILIVLLICNCIIEVVKASKGLFDAIGTVITKTVELIGKGLSAIGVGVIAAFESGDKNGPPKKNSYS